MESMIDNRTKDFLEIIYYLVGILGTPILGIASYIFGICGGIEVFSIFVLVILQIVRCFIIPSWKNKHSENSGEYTKPSAPLTIVIWILIVSILGYNYITHYVEATNISDDEKEIEVDVNIKDNETEIKIKIKGSNITDGLDDSTQIKNEIVESYIIRCKQEEISINEFKALSDEMLYYIRNGIFAYCGLYYSSGYYEQFEWYNAVFMSTDQFDWNVFNTYQIRNINNIQRIEDERKAQEQIGKWGFSHKK